VLCVVCGVAWRRPSHQLTAGACWHAGQQHAPTQRCALTAARRDHHHHRRCATPRGQRVHQQHPSGYEASLDPWLAQLWRALRRHHPLPAGVKEVRWHCCWQGRPGAGPRVRSLAHPPTPRAMRERCRAALSFAVCGARSLCWMPARCCSWGQPSTP
jgi:hypothetical protein